MTGCLGPYTSGREWGVSVPGSLGGDPRKEDRRPTLVTQGTQEAESSPLGRAPVLTPRETGDHRRYFLRGGTLGPFASLSNPTQKGLVSKVYLSVHGQGRAGNKFREL